MNALPIEGLVKTVPASKVEHETACGWVVVGSYQDTITNRFDELGDAPHGSEPSYEYYTNSIGLQQRVPTGKMIVPRYFAETLTYFVLRKDTESVIADLKEQVSKANAATSDVKNTLKETKDALCKAKDDLKKAVGDAENAAKISPKEVEDIFRKKIADLEQDKARLRRDMEELRRCFGVRVVDMSEDAD